MDTTAAIEPPVNNPSTLRVRRYRQRRRERLRLLTVELPGHFIDAAIAGLHPLGETRKLGTGCDSNGLRPLRSGRRPLQVCFKRGRRPVGQGRV